VENRLALTSALPDLEERELLILRRVLARIREAADAEVT